MAFSDPGPRPMGVYMRRVRLTSSQPRAMTRRDLLVPLLAAVGVLGLMAASTLLTVAFTDYEEEALPSITALLGGDVGTFLGRLPAYGGSLILRAPAALLADAAGGGELAVYRALAAPCLLAGVVFGLVLWSRLASRGRVLAAWVALTVVVANPVLLPALDTGHPEEYLGAILCAAGVTAALWDRPILAGVLIGAAGANKAWAVLAVVPALVALGSGRARFLIVTGTVCGAVLAPALVHGTQAIDSAQAVAGQSGVIFQPWQWTWFLGDHGELVRGLYAEKPGYRASPSWMADIGHLPIVLLPLGLGALAWARRVHREQALLLLTACLLVRCVVDPWNTAYYHLPFLMALAAHEVVARRRLPLASVLATVAVYGSTVLARGHVSPDGQAALYLLWSLPAAAMCALALFAPERWDVFARRMSGPVRRALPSISSLAAQAEPASAAPRPDMAPSPQAQAAPRAKPTPTPAG